MTQTAKYEIVKLVSGAHSVHSVAHAETFHPVIGPVAEAEALYVKQIRLAERLARHEGEFVVWDVGLGAAANAVTLLRAAKPLNCPIRLLSFDQTLEPLEFALSHAVELEYVKGYEEPLRQLVAHGKVQLQDGAHVVNWESHVADFPTLLLQPAAQTWTKPHVIMFDAFSPARNPEMWTQPLFANLFRLLSPERPCVLPTYSRSTMLRVTLLLAGFFVGVGHATGEKDETTIAANDLSLLDEPLEREWLARVRRSTSAEPMWEPVYRQARLAAGTLEKLEGHPQFR